MLLWPDCSSWPMPRKEQSCPVQFTISRHLIQKRSFHDWQPAFEGSHQPQKGYSSPTDILHLHTLGWTWNILQVQGETSRHLYNALHVNGYPRQAENVQSSWRFMPYIKDVSEGKAWQGWNTGGSQTTWNTSTKTCFQILSNQMPGFGETASDVTHTTLGRPGNTQRNRVRKHQGTVKLRCGYQPSRANWKIGYKVGNWHASPPLRRETAAATTSGWPNYRLQDIHGSFGYWSELVFPSSRSTRPRRAPLQGTPGWEPPPRKRVSSFIEGCEILEQAPGFRRFQQKVGEGLNRSLSPLTEHSFPHPAYTPHINSYHLDVTQLPVLYMWFLQASFGLLF